MSGQTAHLRLGGHVGGKDVHGVVARCGADIGRGCRGAALITGGDANPGAQQEICKRVVVCTREADSIGRLIEQEKETIGAIDFATATSGVSSIALNAISAPRAPTIVTPAVGWGAAAPQSGRQRGSASR